MNPAATPEWTGTTGIVTGAGSGIGAATASLLAGLGARVIGVDMNRSGLEATIDRAGASVSGVVGDVCDEAVQREAIEAAVVDGRIDFVVNNAAVFILAGLTATTDQWTRTMDVNVIAGAQLSARAVPYLRGSDRAAVVNIASISGHVAQGDRWTYNSSKGAVLELTRCQALDLTPIRFNSVSPGWIWTEVLEEAAGGDRETWEAIWGAYCPEGRCGEPIEVAAAIEFLLSPRASFINGIDLPVDGGYLATSSEGPAVLALRK